MEKLSQNEIQSVTGAGLNFGSIFNGFLKPTTLALGEEGGSPVNPPVVSTRAFGEEDNTITTLALGGEEGTEVPKSFLDLFNNLKGGQGTTPFGEF